MNKMKNQPSMLLQQSAVTCAAANTHSYMCHIMSCLFRLAVVPLKKSRFFRTTKFTEGKVNSYAFNKNSNCSSNRYVLFLFRSLTMEHCMRSALLISMWRPIRCPQHEWVRLCILWTSSNQCMFISLLYFIFTILCFTLKAIMYWLFFFCE